MKIVNSVTILPDDPMKWKKHLLLVTWRLRDKDHLFHSINRYPINDSELCLQDINNELIRDEGAYSFIIKLVYKDVFYKLPNFIILSVADLEMTKEKLEDIKLTQFKEIWYCKNRTRDNDIVFGRMLIGNNPLFPNRCPIRYEMVWGDSAREIEQYPFVNEPFISINQSNWNVAPQVDKIDNKDMSIDEILKISESVITAISHYTTEIIDFASYVFSLGCDYLCLEFNYGDNGFSFIDWDSDDDRKVLDATEF